MKKIYLIILLGLFLTSFISSVSWSNSLNGYWSLNESSGTLVQDTLSQFNFTAVNGENGDWIPALVNNGYRFNELAGTQEYFEASSANNLTLNGYNGTISMWVNFTEGSSEDYIIGVWDVAVGSGDFRIFKESTQNKIQWDIRDGSGTASVLSNNGVNIGHWVYIVATWNDSAIGLYINGTYQGQTLTSKRPMTQDWCIGGSRRTGGGAIGCAGSTVLPNVNGTIDEVSIWNRTLTQSEITDLYNLGNGLGYGQGAPSTISVTLDNPSNNSKESATTIEFNVTIMPNSLNITNATINIWNSSSNLVNSTTNIVTGNITNTSSWNINSWDIGRRYYWNVYACGINTSNNVICAMADNNFTFISSAFSENTVNFNMSLFETSRQRFNLSIDANPSVASASALFWYNGTSHTSSVTDMGSGTYEAINDIDIPLAEQDGNKTFLWEWSFSLNDGTTLIQNSTIYSHEVNRTYFVNCNSTFTTQFLNFTTHSATNPFPDLNATMKLVLSSWLGNGNTKRNNSFEELTESNYTFNFCFFPPDKSMYSNTNIEFDATNYAQNYYYLNNASLNNNTNNIDLYLLNDSLATLTVLNVYDEAQTPINGVLIQIQLYDVGTDTFYTVAMAKSAENGKDLVYLNWYDSLYKFILIQNGEVIKQTSPYKISETPQIFQIITKTTFVYDKFENFIYNLIFNNVTNNFVLTFTKPSGLVDKGCLRVIKRTPYNDTQICSQCETSSSATLYCNINNYGNGTYIATFYATGSLKVIDSFPKFVGTVNEIYDNIGNLDGTSYAFLFSGIIVGLFFITPVLSIIGILIAVIGAMVIGFQPINYFEMIGIVIIGGIIIWIINK